MEIQSPQLLESRIFYGYDLNADGIDDLTLSILDIDGDGIPDQMDGYLEFPVTQENITVPTFTPIFKYTKDDGFVIDQMYTNGLENNLIPQDLILEITDIEFRDMGKTLYTGKILGWNDENILEFIDPRYGREIIEITPENLLYDSNNTDPQTIPLFLGEESHT